MNPAKTVSIDQTPAAESTQAARAAQPAGVTRPSAVKPLVLRGNGAAQFTPGCILLLDSSQINRQLIKGILKLGPYRILESETPEKALQLLETETVDLIITDLVLPSMGGLEFCRRVRSDRRSRLLPLLIVTSVTGAENEAAAFTAGADEIVYRPPQPISLRLRVESLIRKKKLVDELEEAENILFSIAIAVEQRDQETGNHCERLAALSVALGSAIGLPEDDLQALYRGGFLHDIGKIAVRDDVLLKRGALTDDEWTIMRDHTVKGEDICRQMKSLAPVLPIIRNHHEKWDGSGYPDGLKDEQIPLLARILQIADIYDALTSRRTYKPAFSAEDALEQLQKEVDLGWRDPELVRVFCEMVRQPGFVAMSPQLFAPEPEDPEEAARLESVRGSLARMSRELLK
jgi:putative two-component system response regulator